MQTLLFDDFNNIFCALKYTARFDGQKYTTEGVLYLYDIPYN